MNEQTVEALSRRAASMSRRGSLLSLSGALAAAVVAPSLAEAKNTKKAKKKAKKKAAERSENEANLICQNQVEGCRSFVLSACQGGGAQCLAAIQCCSSFGTCDFTGFLSCLVAIS